MTEELLDLAQPRAALQEVGRTRVPELMNAAQRHLHPARDSMRPAPDCRPGQTIAILVHQQRSLAQALPGLADLARLPEFALTD